ncbi:MULTISPECIES: hypothetical protein [unclassified Agrococcus]|uniref:hypothetical protein n=1 Tax=unclassified Agrococcus TaxID=2615065 RepID=UPI003610875A
MTEEIVFDPANVSAAWPSLRERAGLVHAQSPEDPAGVADLLGEIELMLLEIADVLREINDQRYAAERAHSKAYNLALADYAAAHPVTVARSMAKTSTLEEKKAHDDLRALFHHAEDTQTALKTKHIGLLGINKNMTPLIQSGFRR